MKKLLASIFTIVYFSQNLYAQVSKSSIQDFDDYAEKARISWQMPGMAVSVVKDGEIIFQKAYGVTQLGTSNAVNTETIFACASTTKAMTAVCMALLVDKGLVKWDDPVVKHLEDFKLFDPYVTRELKIKDLFIHNSGVASTDFLEFTQQLSPEEILKKMELVKPRYSFRSGFQYQNTFYLVAGKVIEKITGQKWEGFIFENIFKPLQMNSTYATFQSIQGTNVSTPHFIVDGVLKPIKPLVFNWAHPAGSVYSNIEDMSTWMQCMLDSSKYNGGRLLGAQTWTELFRPQVLVPESEFYPTMQLTKPNWTSYSLGWFQQDYKGKKINYHTGSLDGEIAIHGQLAEHRLGIYVFGNLDHAELRHALMYKAFDLFAMGGNRDWNSDFLKLYGKTKERQAESIKRFEKNRVKNTTPSKNLDAYSGKYTDPIYGAIDVSVVNNKLVLNYNNILTATLEHWHYDTFSGKSEKDWWGMLNATFALDVLGNVEKVNVDGFEFKKE